MSKQVHWIRWNRIPQLVLIEFSQTPYITICFQLEISKWKKFEFYFIFSTVEKTFHCPGCLFPWKWHPNPFWRLKFYEKVGVRALPLMKRSSGGGDDGLSITYQQTHKPHNLDLLLQYLVIRKKWNFKINKK